MREINGFTLHVRLTKKCNADCVYCSSYDEKAKRMSLSEYKESMKYILDLVLSGRLFFEPQNTVVSIQYVGGEILTLPQKDLNEIVFFTRNLFSDYFFDVIDGVQSNFIGKKEKVAHLIRLFGKRVSTSVDNFTDSRRLNGSADEYRRASNENREIILSRINFNAPAIFVCDKNSIEFMQSEIALAEKNGYPLRIRPVFNGGKEVFRPNVDVLAKSMRLAAENWLMKSNVAVNPFYELLVNRINELLGDISYSCPYTRYCGGSSLDLEPNGDLYLCLDMADMGHYQVGNAIRKEFDDTLYKRFYERRNRLHADCIACNFFKSCHGGCMAEAINYGMNLYGKTPLCKVWKSIFEAIDNKIKEHGIDEVNRWLSKLIV